MVILSIDYTVVNISIKPLFSLEKHKLINIKAFLCNMLLKNYNLKLIYIYIGF